MAVERCISLRFSLTVMGSRTSLLPPLPPLSFLVAESSSAPRRPTALAPPYSHALSFRPPSPAWRGEPAALALPTSSTTASPGRRGGSGPRGAAGLSFPGILGLGEERQSHKGAKEGRCGSVSLQSLGRALCHALRLGVQDLFASIPAKHSQSSFLCFLTSVLYPHVPSGQNLGNTWIAFPFPKKVSWNQDSASPP